MNVILHVCCVLVALQEPKKKKQNKKRKEKIKLIMQSCSLFSAFFFSNGMCYVLTPKGFKAVKNFYARTHVHRVCIIDVKVCDVSNTELRTL